MNLQTNNSNSALGGDPHAPSLVRPRSLIAPARLGLWIWLTVFFGLLQIAYIVFVSPYFSYMGFTLQFNALRYLEGLMLLFIFIIFLPVRKNAPSSVLLTLYAILLVIPISVLYALGELGRLPAYLAIASGMILIAMAHIQIRPPKRIQYAKTIFLTICLLAVAVTSTWLVMSGALKHFNLNPIEVYGQRASVSDLIYQGPFSYVVPMTLKGFAVGLLVYVLWHRQALLYIGSILLFVFFYGATGHKSVLAIPFLVTAVYLWSSAGGRLWQIPAVMAGVVAIALCISIALDDVYVASILIRRVFFVPAHLIGVYVEYFDDVGYKYFSTVIFARLFSGVTEVAPQSEISVYLTGAPDVWYNAGFVATGFMHAGLLGVLLYAIITGLIIVSVDALARGGYSWPALALMIVPISILYTTADLVTTFLSHGLIVALLLLWFFRADMRFGIRARVT